MSEPLAAPPMAVPTEEPGAPPPASDHLSMEIEPPPLAVKPTVIIAGKRIDPRKLTAIGAAVLVAVVTL